MGQAVIEVENLTKIFGEQLIAVNNVTFTVARGAIFGFLGPNGARKTTTIRLMLGLIRPTAGSVTVFGDKMTPESSSLRSRIGYLPTNPKFPPKDDPCRLSRLWGGSSTSRERRGRSGSRR
jgi:ABC-type multidrug transport system ATPase subunit